MLKFKDYEVLDCGDNEKIERFGDYILRRPDPQAIWHPENFKSIRSMPFTIEVAEVVDLGSSLTFLKRGR